MADPASPTTDERIRTYLDRVTQRLGADGYRTSTTDVAPYVLVAEKSGFQLRRHAKAAAAPLRLVNRPACPLFGRSIASDKVSYVCSGRVQPGC
jgi:hypothetical protein